MPKNTMNISIKLPAYQTKDQRERAKLQIRLALVNLEKKTLKLVRSIMKLTLKKKFNISTGETLQQGVNYVQS